MDEGFLATAAALYELLLVETLLDLGRLLRPNSKATRWLGTCRTSIAL